MKDPSLPYGDWKLYLRNITDENPLNNLDAMNIHCHLVISTEVLTHKLTIKTRRIYR